jgi:predicted AAA+ superfamily ATPase
LLSRNIIHLVADIACTMYPRTIQATLAKALNDTPVVLLNGARQTGISTLLPEPMEILGQAWFCAR